jgi:hypothetical protein
MGRLGLSKPKGYAYHPLVRATPPAPDCYQCHVVAGRKESNYCSLDATSVR